MTHINLRRDTAANWAADNPVLQLGETGWERDTRKGKLGDGVTPWNGLDYIVGDVVLTAADIGLGDVDNTSDLDKPISTATQAALDLKADSADLAAKAPLASPIFTGSPQAPTPAPGDNDTSLATTAFVVDAIATAIAAAKLAQHPVGSIEVNVSGTNPGTYLGGTWVAWGTGRVPVGIDASQIEFDGVEEIGGEKLHTLTIGEMPNHQHTGSTSADGNHDHELHLSVNAGSSTSNMPKGTASGATTRTPINVDGAHTHVFTTSLVGGGGAHNNLQPYITCYMWKRTV